MTHSVTADIYAARHEGQAAVQAADVAVNRMHGQYIARAINVCMSQYVGFTADVVRAEATVLAHAEGHAFTPAPNLIPAIIGGYASAGRIREVGRVTSTRPERRGSKISLWRATT